MAFESITKEEWKRAAKVGKEGLRKFREEEALKRHKGAYKGPKYDEEYLSQFETLPEGYKFTEEELNKITDRAYPGIKRKEHFWNYDHSEEQGYDRKYRPPLATEGNVRALARRNFGPYTPDNYAYIDFYDLAMGKITPREFHRRIFKQMVRYRYEK